MSVKVMNLVWEYAPVSESSLLVLLALADWSNDEGVSWPSMARLGKKARVKERTAQHVVKQLKAADLLSVELGGKGRGSVNRFFINVPRLRNLAAQKDANDDLARAQNLHPKQNRKGVAGGNIRVQSTAAKGANDDLLRVQSTASALLRDPSVDPKTDPLVDPLPFSSPEFVNAYADYEQARREKKKPITPTARKLLFKKMREMGEARSIAALVHSAACGYQGLFEPSGNGSGRDSKFVIQKSEQAKRLRLGKNEQPA